MTTISPNEPDVTAPPLLDADRVDVVLGRGWRASRVLADVSLRIWPGEIVGLVGETGSGKTTLARTIVGLVRPKRGRIWMAGPDAGPGAGAGTDGGTVISALRGRVRRAERRRGRVQFVFQDPLRSLDPELTVDRIVGEGLAIRGTDPGETRTRVISSLEKTGLDASLLSRTPGQISGGQRQRVAIARALAAGPELLICDEPVSALDASNRNYVLRLLGQLRDSLGLSILIISHDLSSLAGIADRVAVLYRGRIVEDGPVGEVFADPGHPYTALLMASAPGLRERGSRERGLREGGPRPDQNLTVRQLRRTAADPEPPSGPDACGFAARCPFAADPCATTPERVVTAGAAEGSFGIRGVACHRHGEWPALAATREEA